ncbi:MAG: hypothetical protein R3E01_24035 [Pirellulaceae bacterium]|nr:hypothetical protein [Planctomycetales bacterium]
MMHDQPLRLPHRNRSYAWWHGTLIFVLLAPLMLSIAGCGGCRQGQTAQKKEPEKKEEKPKPPFERGRVVVFPSDEAPSRSFIKPGHWVTASQRIRANNADFKGDLLALCLDRRSETIRLEGTPYRMQSEQPAILPKGQTKRLEFVLYAPHPGNDGLTQSVMQVETRLQGRGSGELLRSPLITNRLRPHQYYIVTLSRVADAYGYVQKLRCVDPPSDDLLSQGLAVDYVVISPDLQKTVPLPEHPLTWSSTAYLIWDGVDPSILTTRQQRALLDWVHWGGQIIVSGPDSLDLLRGDFLGPHLPAQAGATLPISVDDINVLNQWSVLPRDRQKARQFHLLPSEPLPKFDVTELKLQEGAHYVDGTGQLVAEKHVGRGRIVVTSFPLTDRALTTWLGFDGFFNSVLLRRPAREFQNSDYSVVAVWKDFYNFNRDARVNTNLRYFSRDVRHGYVHSVGRGPVQTENSPYSPAVVSQPANTPWNPAAEPNRDELKWDFEREPYGYDAYLSDSRSGVAGWTDFGIVPSLARQSLRRASGIAVPNAQFVAKVLGIYLIVLVPLNWIVFRLLGRVEWAWFVAPVIAIGGAVAVVRLAQLDIGFVRSRTEIAVLETQPGHTRGHLTRYTALYSSLTTSYDMQYSDDSAVSQPFSINPTLDQLRLQQQATVTYRREKEIHLSGFSVLSNTTGMVHSEHMYEHGGDISLVTAGENRFRVGNHSDLTLRDAVVIRRENGIRFAIPGDIDAKSEVPLVFGKLNDAADVLSLLEKNSVIRTVPPEGEVGLREIVDLALDPRALKEGEARMVAWTDQELPGLVVSPRSRQETFRTVVVSNLRYAPWTVPIRDYNCYDDVDSTYVNAETDTDTDTDTDAEVDSDASFLQ